jgi:ubiquitin-like 1-activating enzyme E1 B
MSKSKVAKESVLEFCPDAKVEALHDSVMNSDYGVTFFKGFNMVLNALDNRAARSHVNRMCLAADVPLVESGTAGYLGQVTVIRKGKTECYECQPKPHQKTFPGCTIRNTPSEPIHCIVWSKHLFNQLFGEADPDEDVSPDSEDPEIGKDKTEQDGNVTRISTRQWAQDNKYDAKMIFNKMFNEDIKYLLTMDKLWAKRRPPTPLDWDTLSYEKEKSAAGAIHDQIMWSLHECADILGGSIDKLKSNLEASDYKDSLVWDKDDEAAMDFVAACANIRAHVFNIPQKTRFDIKSMAGNIIPAIATTNAVIAGGIVMEALKILNGQEDKCRTVSLK